MDLEQWVCSDNGGKTAQQETSAGLFRLIYPEKHDETSQTRVLPPGSEQNRVGGTGAVPGPEAGGDRSVRDSMVSESSHIQTAVRAHQPAAAAVFVRMCVCGIWTKEDTEQMVSHRPPCVRAEQKKKCVRPAEHTLSQTERIRCASLPDRMETFTPSPLISSPVIFGLRRTVMERVGDQGVMVRAAKFTLTQQ